MRSVRNLALLVAVVALAVASSSARADENAKGKKHHGHGAHGVVTSVDAKAGTITVLVTPHHRKRGADAAAAATDEKPVEKTFAVNGDTKYFLVSGKKGEDKKAATLDDVKQGERVVVLKTGDGKDLVAKEVLIRQKKDKKPAA